MPSNWKRSFGMAAAVCGFEFQPHHWTKNGSAAAASTKICHVHPMFGLEQHVHEPVPIQCQEPQLCSVNMSATPHFSSCGPTQKTAKIHTWGPRRHAMHSGSHVLLERSNSIPSKFVNRKAYMSPHRQPKKQRDTHPFVYAVEGGA